MDIANILWRAACGPVTFLALIVSFVPFNNLGAPNQRCAAVIPRLGRRWRSAKGCLNRICLFFNTFDPNFKVSHFNFDPLRGTPYPLQYSCGPTCPSSPRQTPRMSSKSSAKRHCSTKDRLIFTVSAVEQPTMDADG